MVDVLALLGYSGRVVCAALALGGLQRGEMALQLNVAARGQGHVVRPARVPVDLCPLWVELVRLEVLAGFRRGGQVHHPDVWDAGLSQDQF